MKSLHNWAMCLSLLFATTAFAGTNADTNNFAGWHAIVNRAISFRAYAYFSDYFERGMFPVTSRYPDENGHYAPACTLKLRTFKESPAALKAGRQMKITRALVEGDSLKLYTENDRSVEMIYCNTDGRNLMLSDLREVFGAYLSFAQLTEEEEL